MSTNCCGCSAAAATPTTAATSRGASEYPGADFRWLAANVVRDSTGRTILPGTMIKKVRGVKVGYIGMTLEATPALVAQVGIQGITFLDEVETANRAARELKRRGVETIIVLLHEGGFQSGTYQQCVGPSGPIVEIAQNLHSEIDLVVTGHTHQPYICDIPDPRGRSRMVTSAASFGRVVTETTLHINARSGDVKRDQTTSTNHLVTRQNPDPVQTEIINRWDTAAAPIANRGRRHDHRRHHPVAEPRHRGPARQPDRRCAAGRHLRSSRDGGAQIALMNPGGVRADLTFEPDLGR